jgi:hypothetical protein
MFSENTAGAVDHKSSDAFANVCFSKPVLFSGKQYTRQDELIRDMLSDWNAGVSFCLDGQLVSSYRENDLSELAEFTEQKIRFAKSMTGDRDSVFFMAMYLIDPSIKGLFWKGFDFGSLHKYGKSLVDAHRRNSRVVAGCEDPADVTVVQSAVPMIENGLLSFYLSRSGEQKKGLYGFAIKSVEDRLAEYPEDYPNPAIILGLALWHVNRVRATFDAEGDSFEELMSTLRKYGDIPEVLERNLKAKPELMSDDAFRSFLLRYSSAECPANFVWKSRTYPSLRVYGIQLCETYRKIHRSDGNIIHHPEKKQALLNSARAMIEYGLIRFYLSRAGEEKRNLYMPAVEKAERLLADKHADGDSVALILGTELRKIRDFPVPKKENSVLSSESGKICSSDDHKKGFCDLGPEPVNVRISVGGSGAVTPENCRKTKIRKIHFASPEQLLDFLRVVHDTDGLVYGDFLVKNYAKLLNIKKHCPVQLKYDFKNLCPEKNGYTMKGETGCFGYFGSAEQIIGYIDMLFKSGEYFFLHDFYRHCVPDLESELLFSDMEEKEMFKNYCNQMSKIILIDSTAYQDADECVGKYLRLRSLDMAEAENFLKKCLDYADDNRDTAEGDRLYSALQQYAGSLISDNTGDYMDYYMQEVDGGTILL